MVIDACLQLLLVFLDFLLGLLNIPSLPADIAGKIAEFLAYIVTGARIIATYTHFEYLLVLIGFVIVVKAAILLTKIIRWILRKIPFLGIS